MYDNYNYPCGADTPNAPWNEIEIPERDFEVTCSQSLSRTATVTTNNYLPCVDEGCDDGVGYHEEWADTSDTNWADEYSECGYMTPLELIDLLKEYLEKDLRNIQRDMLPNDRSSKATKARMLKGLIEECECWTEDETDFEQD